MKANPIVIGNVLHTTTPKYRVIALDARTGQLLWRFDPYEDNFAGAPELDNANRGVTY
jgi:quinohemoprotein ethanol dehydrogenase